MNDDFDPDSLVGQRLEVDGDDEGETPIVVRLSDVEPEPISWLWPDRIALGKLTLIAGDPGLGKSFVTLDISARVSSGTPWPDRRTEPNAVGGVVLLSAEDDVSDTIRPRLDAAGADVTRVNLIQGIEYFEKRTAKRSRRSFNLEQDLPSLEAAIRGTTGCRLVVVDPVSAYLGKVESHNNSEIRGLLAPLSELASRYRVAVVAVTHLNKGGGANALYRAMGSLAFVAAARAAWLVVPDADNPKRRLFLCAKNNIGPDRGGLAYELTPSGTVAYVAWEAEPVATTADEALGAVIRKGEERKTGKVVTSGEWLKEQLANGPVPMRELEARWQDAGISEASIRRASGKLGIVPRKLPRGPWVWELPGSGEGKATQPDSQDAQEPRLAEDEHLEHLEHLGPETESAQLQDAQGAQDAQPQQAGADAHLESSEGGAAEWTA